MEIRIDGKICTYDDPQIVFCQIEVPLNTMDSFFGTSFPLKVILLELNVGSITAVAVLLPLGRVIVTTAEIAAPWMFIEYVIVPFLSVRIFMFDARPSRVIPPTP